MFTRVAFSKISGLYMKMKIIIQNLAEPLIFMDRIILITAVGLYERAESLEQDFAI